VTGTILNAAAIVVGGVAGVTLTKDLSVTRLVLVKKILGIFTVWVGLRMTWEGLNGNVWEIARQLAIVVVALMLGKITGRLLHIQAVLNGLGRYAKQQFSGARPDEDHRFSDGFITCSILFCVGPLAVLGALQDGLYGNIRTLAIKACIDGLATMAFARTFGWGVIVSALPVLAFQGSITLLAQVLEPLLVRQSVLDSVGAAGGLLIFCVALVILELKRIELADYLPSLIYAPLIASYWH
jgi:uncharacterized membrane protein YqgA involved in biofilm formation